MSSRTALIRWTRTRPDFLRGKATGFKNVITIEKPPRHGTMRPALMIAFAVLAAANAWTADSKPKAVLSFDLTATNKSFVVRPEKGFVLTVEQDSVGWEVDVSRTEKREFLLYPSLNWHGAHPCQLSAWSHARATFPDERIIRVRGYKRWVRIILIDAKVSGAQGSEQFIGGRADIYWQEAPKSR